MSIDVAGLFAPYPAGRRFPAGDLVGGRYRIERFIGAGGMGEVYGARDEITLLLSDRVAVELEECNLTADLVCFSKEMVTVLSTGGDRGMDEERAGRNKEAKRYRRGHTGAGEPGVRLGKRRPGDCGMPE